jgi:diadenosine tetraphosphatase ApaH/serine/threonine PP2A family protein phosphatase
MLALLYDVHGNLPALEAVLADAGDAGADRFLLGGDYALFGPFPSETVARLRELPVARWLRGNGERWVAHPREAPHDETVQGAIEACRWTLGAGDVHALGELPEQHVEEGARYCHASPISDVRSFSPSTDEPDADSELLGDAAEARVVFGHTHLAFARRGPNDVELVNPGSVGMPFDGDPRAAYAVVHDDGRVEHRRVEYDHGASARALRRRFPGEWSATVAARIEQARFDAKA